MNNGALSATDVIKNSVLEAFTSSGSMSVGQLLLGLALSLACGLYIFFIYKRTFNGVLYSRNFNISLLMLTLVTALIIRTISSSISLSLGMVGALSIVRFRTAVKDPLDTTFMFWAVAAGITIGAGFYVIGLVGSVIIGLFLYFFNMIKWRSSYPYLLIVRHDFSCANEVSYAMRKLPRGSRLKSKTVTRNGVEITMEVRLPGENTHIVNDFLAIGGVFDATLISYQGDYGA
ncbi:MAG: DUF4956 domain-containing protein [Eubacteriales bacterium]|nr:DUF4956 domain-containing protein [Eubacteriales bacterium]